MKKDFKKVATPSAADQIIGLVEEGADVPEALVKRALKEGFAGHFSFYITEPTEEIEKGAPYIAIIYPTSKDATFKCAEYIRRFLPEAISVDACAETEWHFLKARTPAKLAKLLTDRGLVWDMKEQKRCEKSILPAIKASLKR